MKKFLVLYLAPAAVIEDWSRTDPQTRRTAEEKMRAEWIAWTRDQGAAVTGTEAGGRTRRVSADGVADVKNDIMLVAFIEAESHEAAMKPFEHHPHLQIPRSSIEVMELRALTGM